MGKLASPWIGVDLGSLNSCVAVFKHLQNRVEIIPNDQGNRTAPSCVSFSRRGRLVGDKARGQAPLNPRNTLWCTNRLLGRKYQDAAPLYPESRPAPFQLVSKGDRPYIRVDYRGEQRDIAPEEIMSAVVRHMKEAAEAHLGQPVSDAVIAVPSSYSCGQRQGVLDAATIAGLTGHLLNVTDAAALSYYHLRPSPEERNVLIIDMGATATSVSLYTFEGGLLEVKAVAGNLLLGGEDFDDRVVDYFMQEFKRKTQKDISGNARAIRRLRTTCERAKCLLSSASRVSIDIDSLFEGADLYSSFSREKFEELCEDLFRRIEVPIDKVLRDAKLEKFEVDEVVFVGGCSRIPRLQKIVSSFFNGKEILKVLNPDETVASGAAIHAASQSGQIDETKFKALLLSATSSSIGIATVGSNSINCAFEDEPHLWSLWGLWTDTGSMEPLIKRNTTIPVTRRRVFTTYHNNQTTVLVRLFEGECARTKDNAFLGEVKLDCIQPASSGVPQIEVTLDVGTRGITVSVRDLASDRSSQLQISRISGCLSPSEIHRMIEDSRKYQIEDEAYFLRLDARTELENYVNQLRNDIKEKGLANRIDDIDLAMLKSAVDKITSWLRNFPGATKEQYEHRRHQLEYYATPALQHSAFS